MKMNQPNSSFAEIKYIFFDLDRTLWDFEANTRISILETFQKFQLQNLGVSDFEDFYKRYTSHNLYLWNEYKKEKITKDFLKIRRFQCVLQEFGIFNNTLAEQMSNYYINISGTKTLLIEGAIEILEYLFPKYPLYIITNGFNEVQFTKVKVCGLEKYFKDIITSDEAGVKKPDSRIYRYALEKTGAKADSSVMIGDELEADVLPAKSCGMKGIWFSKGKESNEADYVIQSLLELKNIL